jgi:diacylglycerol kinase (ATP)
MRTPTLQELMGLVESNDTSQFSLFVLRGMLPHANLQCRSTERKISGEKAQPLECGSEPKLNLLSRLRIVYPSAADSVRPNILIIVNPASGGGRALAAETLVASYLASQSKSIQFVHSRSWENMRELAANGAAEGYRYVIALGGDGTFHHVVEGIRGTHAIAGFFPAGNGNDIARDLGIPTDAVSAAAAFCHSVPRAVDLVRVQFPDGRAHFIGAGGMGLDAEAAHLANTRFNSWPGVTRYLAGALRTFFSKPAFELVAELDGTRWMGRAIFAAVANSSSYGSGVRIAPDAKMDDGWLDVVLVEDIAWTRLVEAIPIVLTTGDLRFDEVKRFRCRRAVLRADRAVKVHGDGELLGESPAEFEILPAAIHVMVPTTVAG